VMLGKIGDARKLPMFQDAVVDAQPAHIRVLRRRDVKETVIAPAEIIGGFRKFVFRGLLFQPSVSIEWMLLALEFFLIGKFSARRRHFILRDEMRGIRPFMFAGSIAALDA